MFVPEKKNNFNQAFKLFKYMNSRDWLHHLLDIPGRLIVTMMIVTNFTLG